MLWQGSADAVTFARTTSGAANLGDLLRRECDPAAPAVTDLSNGSRPRTTSHGELVQLIDAIGRGLRKRGIEPGARVAIFSSNRMEFIAAYFGVMRGGYVAVPINARMPRPATDHMFADSQVAAVFVDAERAAACPGELLRIGFDGDADLPFETLLDPGEMQAAAPGESCVAKILYTSGSTGRPKGVLLGHRAQLWALQPFLQRGPDLERQTALVAAPLFHKNGLFNTTVTLANHGSVVLMPAFEPRAFLGAIAHHHCTYLSGVPTMFAMLSREIDLLARLELTSVRSILIGSAPLTQALVDRVQAMFPHATIGNGYGTTEAGPAVFGAHPGGLPRPALALGYPLDGVSWRLVDGPSPDQGTLLLKTPAMMAGYLNLPDATAARFRDGWYDTGDVVRRAPDGFFYFVGRADDMFVCGGENVYPGEVERVLEQHPDVAQAVVVAAPDDMKGAIPVAFVRLRVGATVTAADIKAFALARGPAYSHPRVVVLIERIPLASTHKVDRQQLSREAERYARSSGRARLEGP